MTVKVINVVLFLIGAALIFFTLRDFTFSGIRVLLLAIGITIVSVILSEPYWSKE